MPSKQSEPPAQVASVPQEVTGQPRRVVVGGVSWRDTFAALKHRNFRLFFVGQLVSLIGTWMQNTAQSWLVYQLTGAKLPLGILPAGCLGFLFNNSAYCGEIYRAGLGSMGAGQREAARSTGLTAWQAMAFVVIPQAVRNVLPDLVSNTVEVVKLTSLASVVALPEMLYSADMA